MTDAIAAPKTLKEAIEYFADKTRCFEYAVKLRRADGTARWLKVDPKIKTILGRQ